MSNLEKKLAAGVRAARDEQDDNKADSKSTPAAAKPADAGSTAASKPTPIGSRKAATTRAAPKAGKPAAKRPAPAKKPAASRPAATSKRRTKAEPADTGTELHPERVWPD